MIIANAGVPMIALQLPVMVIALIPIILLEAWIYRKQLGVEWSEAWRGSAAANATSTFLGIPVAWFVLVVVQMVVGGGSAWGMDTPLKQLAAVTLQAAWLIPYEENLDWMIPAAGVVLLIPFLLVSVLVERAVLLQCWRGTTKPSLSKAVSVANIASYLLLAAFWGSQLYLALT